MQLLCQPENKSIIVQFHPQKEAFIRAFCLAGAFVCEWPYLSLFYATNLLTKGIFGGIIN